MAWKIQNRVSDRSHHPADPSLHLFGIDFNAIGMVFLYGALVFTVWSGIDYFVNAKKYLV